MRRAGLALLSALLCCGCAQVREISGGPKDEEGPILEEASPPSGTVRFAGDRFVMLFDERVQVNRPKGGLLVSPPMDPPPTISVSGAREVTVSWKNELRPNTTYSFAIGEAVQDLSERNPARGLTYALSTGDAVDSLSVTGTVTHAFSGAPVEDALVMAYDAQDTSSFTKGRPMFVSDNNGFDWQWVNWYLHHFTGGNPFGHSSANLGSLYKGLVKDTFQNFKHLRKTAHTHNPLDDAKGNAEALLHLRDAMGLKIGL